MISPWRIVWHHQCELADPYPHVYGRPTDCYCEPEIESLGLDGKKCEHRVVKHQDMTRAMMERRITL